MNDLLHDPDRYVDHLQRYTTSVASTVLYGMRTSTAENGYVKDLMDVCRPVYAYFNVDFVHSGWKKHPMLRTSNW
jgi:hypothetical protein